MTKRAINPPELFNSLQYGFSQITVKQGSRIVTVSGQVGWDEHEQLVGSDLPAQTFKAFSNLELAMRAVGGTMHDIVSLRIYIVASAMENTACISQALKQYFTDQPPTTNWIGITRLAGEGLLIEIEALAVLD